MASAAVQTVAAAAEHTAAEDRTAAEAHTVMEVLQEAASADSSASAATNTMSLVAQSSPAVRAFPGRTNRPIRRGSLNLSTWPRHRSEEERIHHESPEDCRGCSPVELRALNHFQTVRPDTHRCPEILRSGLDATIPDRLDESN